MREREGKKRQSEAKGVDYVAVRGIKTGVPRKKKNGTHSKRKKRKRPKKRGKHRKNTKVNRNKRKKGVVNRNKVTVKRQKKNRERNSVEFNQKL